MQWLIIQIADEMKPYPVLIDVMDKLVRLIPTWKIVPGPDIIDVAFRAPEIRNEVTLIYFRFINLEL